VVRALLIRGLLVGLAAGLLAFLVAHTIGEPQIRKAINFENHREAVALARVDPHAHLAAGQELVSRHVQSTFGLLLGNVVLSIALGGLFALAFAFAYARIGAFSARATAAILALGAYLTITVAPFTKYPANPPSIGNPDTIGRRTVLFFAMIAISVSAGVAAARIRGALKARLGPWNAAICALAAFVALIVAAELILPPVHETPPGFPADVLFRFRQASLLINATIWTTLGLGFGALAERVLGVQSLEHERGAVPPEPAGVLPPARPARPE
jgi:hypothetical protein